MFSPVPLHADGVAQMTVQVKGLDQFQGKVTKFVTNAPKADRKIVNGVALKSKATLLVGATPKHLSRFANGRGVTLKANYKIKDGPPVNAVILPTPPGPWYLLEGGGKAHDVGRRGSRRGARRGQPGFLGRPGVFAAVGPVRHPGSPPERTWSRAVGPAIRGGQQVYRQQAARTYLSMF
jgi:hypothetical protein